MPSASGGPSRPAQPGGEASRYDAIVLAGGEGRRLGGADKAELEVSGVSLLDRAVEALRGADRVVVVGPRRGASAPVRWTRERPPGGGPVAALEAGLREVAAPVVVVLAVDMPFVDAGVVARLVSAAAGSPGAVLVDGTGRRQHLAAAYNAATLRARLGRLASSGGVPMRSLVEGVPLAEVKDEGASLDCDTWEQVERARLRGGGRR